MATDAFGLALAVLSELRYIVKSIQDRRSCYNEGPDRFASIGNTLMRLGGLSDKIADIVRANPSVLPHDLFTVFVETLRDIKIKLELAESSFVKYCSTAFIEERSSGCCRNLASRRRRALRAKRLAAIMNEIQCETTGAENKLQHLLTQLSTVIKVVDLQSAIEEHGLSNERFYPAFNVPALSRVCLDFESREPDGRFASPEAILKSFVLLSTRNVTAASGGTHPVSGAAGMAGVGKTIALIALGHDRDIRAHFVHGVLYLNIGVSATVGDVTDELEKIMRFTGAMTQADKVQSSTCLSEAVSHAAIWFRGKRILFLIDDIWPNVVGPQGYLTELKGILNGSQDSRIAISTRSLRIATKFGLHVEFSARDPFGTASMTIFMAHAAPGVHPSASDADAAKAILRLCSGLPIALSIAGEAVYLLVTSRFSFQHACETYLQDISKAKHAGASFLDIAIRVSLSSLEGKRGERRAAGIERANFSISELYTSLCVLQNQKRMPVSVLARMWNVETNTARNICIMFNSMSLAMTSTQTLEHGQDVCELSVHDLHLEFCRQCAAENDVEEMWHQRLLNGHASLGESCSERAERVSDEKLLGFNMLQYTPRSWWSDGIENAVYIRQNLSRHLRSAGFFLELGATMLDFRWMNAQALAGGVLGVTNDFDILEETIKIRCLPEPTLEAPALSVRDCVGQICSVFVAGSSSFGRRARVLSYWLLYRLFQVSQTSSFIRQFLENVKRVTPKPFLIPTVSFINTSNKEMKLRMELHSPGQTKAVCRSADFSSGEIVAGDGHDVAVYSLKTQLRLKLLKGHSKNVTVVRFNSDALKVVSGSLDKRIIVWEWSQSESPFFVMDGHKGAITAISLSNDETRLFSGSSDSTVNMWSMKTGKLCRTLSYDAEVECVSACPKNEIVAIGTRDGRLRCINWVSEEYVLEHKMSDGDAVSAVKFGPDGHTLVSGSAGGAVTSWSTTTWTSIASVHMRGVVKHISFHPDGTNVMLCSLREGVPRGEIRNWRIADEKLSVYNMLSSLEYTGVAFRNKGNDVIVASEIGVARVWIGPTSAPVLDFESDFNSRTKDLSLSHNGSRVASIRQDGKISLWSTDDGREISSYAPLDGGYCRIALNGDGTMVASASSNGAIRLWNPEFSPSNSSTLFKVGDGAVEGISFGLSDRSLLVCVPEEVQIWDVGASQKVGHLVISGALDAAFSVNGQFIITGSNSRTSIWEASSKNKIFDSSQNGFGDELQAMSLSDAEILIRTCGPLAHRLSSFVKATVSPTVSHDIERSLNELTIANFGELVPPNADTSRTMMYCGQVIAHRSGARMTIAKLQK